MTLSCIAQFSIIVCLSSCFSNSRCLLNAHCPLHLCHEMLRLQRNETKYNHIVIKNKNGTDSGRTWAENSDKLSDKGWARAGPLFYLEVPLRLGGPPVCPGPYAPAYPDPMLLYQIHSAKPW